jgi:hypothetical protein
MQNALLVISNLTSLAQTALVKKINLITPAFVLQVDHLSPDEHSLAGYCHLADTNTLNANK